MLTTHKKIYVLLTYICSMFISILLMCFISPLPLDNWSGCFNTLTLILLCITIISFKLSNIPFLSVFSLLALMSYLFQFGSNFCYAIGYKVSQLQQRMSYYMINEASFKHGCEIALGCIMTLTLGGLFENLLSNNRRENFCENKIYINKHFYKILGIIIILISMPFWIYTLIHSIRTIVSGNSYTALAGARLPGYITSLGKFIYVGIMVIIFYYHQTRNNLCKNLWIFVFFVLLGMVMILGARSEPMTILFAFLIFSNHCIDFKIRFDLKRILSLIVGIYLLANILYAIQISRNSGFNIVDIFSKFFTAGPNAIINEIFEFGYTEYSTASVTSRIVKFHPTWFFIKEISSITPIPIESKYTIVASVAAGTPELGTSFIGEMYYYFGNFCYLACFFIAIYVSKIEKWLYMQVHNKNYYIFFMFLMWMWQEINCIRASFNLSIKTIIYSFILFESSRTIYFSIYKKIRFEAN